MVGAGKGIGRNSSKEEGTMTTGKFSDELCEKLYELSLDGGPDDEYGNCSEPPFRWWGLLIKSGVRGAQNAILTEDSQGFVDYETFPSAKQARAALDHIVAEVSAEM